MSTGFLELVASLFLFRFYVWRFQQNNFYLKYFSFTTKIWPHFLKILNSILIFQIKIVINSWIELKGLDRITYTSMNKSYELSEIDADVFWHHAKFLWFIIWNFNHFINNEKKRFHNMWWYNYLSNLDVCIFPWNYIT